MLAKIFSDPDFNKLNLEFKMKNLMERFCDYARLSGSEILPYRDPSLKIFSSLSHDKQENAYNAFLKYYGVCSAATYEDIRLSDDPSLLWYVIKELGLRPCSDLFNKIQPNDVIEIYNTDFIQIFRNFAFFSICSYSLEEIFSYEWRELYERDPVITGKLAELAFSLLSGDVKTTIPILGIGDHQLTEVFSPSRHKMVVNHSYLSPLFGKSKGKVEAFAIFSKAKVIGRELASQGLVPKKSNQSLPLP
jgi:hypothetical protein